MCGLLNVDGYIYRSGSRDVGELKMREGWGVGGGGRA